MSKFTDRTAALRLTGVTTPLPLLIGAVETELKATVEVAQRFCSLLVCGYGRENDESFVAAFAASFDSSQNRCVVTPNVSRKRLSAIQTVPAMNQQSEEFLSYWRTLQGVIA